MHRNKGRAGSLWRSQGRGRGGRGASRAVYVQVAAPLTAIGTPRTATGISRQRRPVDSERAQAAQDCRQARASHSDRLERSPSRSKAARQARVTRIAKGRTHCRQHRGEGERLGFSAEPTPYQSSSTRGLSAGYSGLSAELTSNELKRESRGLSAGYVEPSWHERLEQGARSSEAEPLKQHKYLRPARVSR